MSPAIDRRDVLARALWIAAGAVLLAVAYLLRDHAWPFTNVLIPAGAWALLRGAL